ncbi:response regulator [Chryseobacterium nematophagum]|uniref:Response regulator n=1 Tax=Chryseobacterium nematophagum TaxID=2305228 RepID=A0A3M7L8U9_9FLAO|nr:response regulator [Chryseobacterium nematophagum]RMZ59027.1 response regulator [Chryseobacterium nematophagum]
MNKEYLNIIVADSDEENVLLFKNICKDLKIGIKLQTFNNGDILMEYLNDPSHIIPEVLFMDYDIAVQNRPKCLEEIKLDYRLNNLITVIYAEKLSEHDIEDVFVKGANIFMLKTDNYDDIKKRISDAIIMNWQYHTSGLNKDNFIARI